MNTIKMLNEALETKYHLNEAKEDKERFLSFINATIKDNIKSQAIVDNFDKLKSSGRIKGEEADYYYWIKNKTVDELQDFLNAFNTSLSKTQTKKQEKAGAELIPCPNKDWVIYKINTYDASKYYGEHTKWCITGRNGPDGIGAFNSYKNRGVKDYYFFWKIGNEKNGKWCYCDYGTKLNINNKRFVDSKDHPHTIEDVDIPDDVLLSLPGISQKTFDDIQEKKDRELKQSDILKEVQKTGIYTYNSLDDKEFIRGLKPKKIIVPDRAKEIEKYAFYNYTSVQDINLPNSIEKIGESVFSGCTSLQEINLPNSVKEIGNWAFQYCASLQEINIPNSVEKIGISAFSDCTSLQEIALPNSIKEIENYAFENCISLQEITFPNSVEKIGYCAFRYCTSLQEINIPNRVKEIESHAFYDCTSLKEIKIKGEYRPQIFKNARLIDAVILNWADCGIKETWGNTKI